MRYLAASLILWGTLCAAASAHGLPECTRSGVEGLRHVGQKELEAHGGQAEGQVTAPFGALKIFDFYIDYVVGKDGRIVCLSAENGDETPLTPTPERQAFVDTLAGATLTPFKTNGQPAEVLTSTYVREDERPQYHVEPPRGDLATAVIQLENHGPRSGDGPFTVIIRGDGTVTYLPSRSDDGSWYGTLIYHIPPEQVAAMLDLAVRADYWSLRDAYVPYVEPRQQEIVPEYYHRVAITYGGKTKDLRVYDWGYNSGGASNAAAHLMADMAAVARIDLWHSTSLDTITLLQANGFNFRSDRGGRLLVEAATNPAIPDSAIDGLIVMGAPKNYVETGRRIDDLSLLDAAIVGGRTAMAERIIAEGGLTTKGKTDPVKRDRAFDYAVGAASPELVAQLLTLHPAMTLRHDDFGPGGATEAKDPIITHVGDYRVEWPDTDDTATADLVAVTQQLVAAGADLNSRDADGLSLVDHAIDNNQSGFVRWLVGQGLTPSQGAWDDLLSGRPGEEMIVLLLDLGVQPDTPTMKGLVAAAQAKGWSQVEAWLRAHGKWPKG